MLFESGGFAFDINHSLNTQGTRNLMTFLFIFQSGANVANATAEPPDTQILSDPSALPARCGFTCKAARRHRGWWPGSSSRRCPTGKKYITICVFTTVTPERQALYEKTLNVFLAEIASGN
ncbi:hypothetical protein C8R44DRAFT_762867 [Mycena epipterygia]|nr:hypothetical protein C8R44DRAFT_762867 [Mycena epipterygia]